MQKKLTLILILILVLIIVMIVRSMFGAGAPAVVNTPAYTARFPPLECPPRRSRRRGNCRATSRTYLTAIFWAGTSGRHAMWKSSFQPARVSSVPRKER